MHPLEAFDSMPAKTSYLSEGKEHSSVHAERLDVFGHFLTTPATWWINGFSRVFLLKYKPGWWGQKSSAPCEVLYRVALLITGIVGLPLALLSTLFGGSLRSIASLYKRDFIFHQQPVRAGKNWELSNPKECSIMSYNVQLMAEFLVSINRQRPTLERVHEVSKAIIKHNPDIVCLQEVFHTGAAAILDRDLYAKGYHIIRNVGHQSLGLNSGLFIASKYELSNVQFIQHPPLQDGIDKVASKGMLLATAKIGKKNVVIANAHYSNAGTKDLPNHVIRAAQSLAMTARIDKYVKDMMSKGVTIDGVIFNTDANIGPTSFEEDDDKRTPKPSLDPEWHLINRLHADLDSLSIPKGKDYNKLKAWSGFVKKVKQTYADIAKDLPANNKLDFVKNGGPLPSSLYTHDLQTATNYNDAIKGSFIDLNAHPELVWGKKTAAYPVRLDFIMSRKPFTHQGKTLGQLKMHSFAITPMLSDDGRLTSDHHAVKAKFDIDNPQVI